MADSEYDYTISPLAIDSLTQQIQQSSIVTALDYINALGSATTIFFKAALSDADKTTLDAVVAAHTGIPLVQNQASKVIQILGADTVTLCPFGTIFDAPANQTTTFDFKLNTGCYIKGGVMYASPGNVGDSIIVQIVDVDNIMGVGANTVIAIYVDNWYVIPQDMNAIEDVSLSEPIPAGLYIRFVYTNSSTTLDTKVIMNILAYQGIV